MSKTWKWLIGIFIGLLLVCVIAGLAFMVFGSLRGTGWMMGAQLPHAWDGGRLNPRNDIPWNLVPMRPNLWMHGFMPFGGLLRVLFCLGFLALLGLGVAALVAAFTQSRKPATATASPVHPVNEPDRVTTPARACPNCQHEVNPDWSHCPYCGSALTPPEQ